MVALVLSLGVTSAFAEGEDPAPAPTDDPNQYGVQNQAHTITVTSNGTGVHKYEAYQVFYGNLNAEEGVLSDIKWGSGVNGPALLNALSYDEKDMFQEGDWNTSIKTAADVARVLAANKNNASFLEAFADYVSENLTETKAGFGSTPGGETDNYVDITVYGDGYYFVKDTTKLDDLANGDTSSKFILQVVKDIDIVAKDTVLKPDKEILIKEGKATPAEYETVKDGTAAVGDVVTFQVTIPVPDTTAYKDHFVFIMNDQLPAGLTFYGMDSVKINGVEIPAKTESNGTGTAAAYTLTAKTGNTAFTLPTTVDAAVAAAGGQTIEVVFNNFKAYVDNANAIGKDVVITYNAVVNDDAVYGSTGNMNEVYFDYSNNPNHDYHGDNPGDEEPMGETPHDYTKTYVAGLKILKVDGSNNNNPLAGAEFEVSSTSYNKTVTKGTRFEKDDYAVEDGETIEKTGETPVSYWKLKDGTYTKTDPATEGINTTQYESTEQKYVKVSWDKIVITPDADAEKKVVTLVTGEDGVIDINGLKPGTYTIKETQAPDGYNKIADTLTLVIDWGKTSDEKSYEFKIGEGSSDGFILIDDTSVTPNSANAFYKIQVVNNSGTTLPSTGGIGTTIFYVVGGVLVLAAIILLVTKKRMSE